MTALLLISTGLVCYALARLERQTFASSPAIDAEDEAGWEEAVRRSLGWLRPWLAIGPVCWLAAFATLAATAGEGAWGHVAAGIGMLPLKGVLLTATAGGLHVAGVLRQDEDHGPALLLTLLSALACGVALGTTIEWILMITS